MRTVYALVTVFLILTVFFTRWYLCDIRGLCTFPGDQFVGDKLTAIIEILVMMLVVFLIGFAASWLLRENHFQKIRQQALGLMKEWSSAKAQLEAFEKENQMARKHLAEWQSEAKNLDQGKRALEMNLTESQSLVSDLQEEVRQYQVRYDNLKSENDSIRESETKLKHEINEGTKDRGVVTVLPTPTIEPVKSAVSKVAQSRFTPSTWQIKDDLTLISGIGPGIQKKLNELGIYSFQQICEFTPDDVELVARSLKVFKGRIGKDNWIGQAAALRIK